MGFASQEQLEPLEVGMVSLVFPWNIWLYYPLAPAQYVVIELNIPLFEGPGDCRAHVKSLYGFLVQNTELLWKT